MGSAVLAPGQHTFRLDYSQNSVPNLPAGNNAALMLQVRHLGAAQRSHSAQGSKAKPCERALVRLLFCFPVAEAIVLHLPTGRRHAHA